MALDNICLLCAEPANELKITNIFTNRDVMKEISRGLGCSIEPDPALPNVLCYGCIGELLMHLNRQRDWIINIHKFKKMEHTGFAKWSQPPTTLANIINNFESHNGRTLINTEETEIANSDTSGLLEPLSEMSENALDTESGGSIHVENARTTSRNRNQQQSILKCTYCNKIYKSLHFFRRHMRRHTSERRSKSVTDRIYQCDDQNCKQTFDQMSALKKHQVLHKTNFKCIFCGDKFTSSYDYNWHQYSCKAQVNRSGKRMQTRSVSRALRIASSSGCSTPVNDDSETTTDIDSVYTERMRRLHDWRSNQNNEHPSESPNIGDVDHDISQNDDSRTFDDFGSSVSAAITLSSDSSKSEKTLYRAAKKRRKALKEGRKKAKQRGQDYFPCSYGANCNCTFASTSLAKTMDHERVVHHALLLHLCKECQEWFSTRENLIRHRKRHRAYYQKCINCHQPFSNDYNLEHHMMLHHEKSYPCDFCPMSFLKECELNEHKFTFHEDENVPLSHGIIIRSGERETRTFKQVLFSRYKTKDIIQPCNRRLRRTTKEIYRKRIGNVANLYNNEDRQPNYWVYGNDIGSTIIGPNYQKKHSRRMSLVESETLIIPKEEFSVRVDINVNGMRSPETLEEFDMFSVDTLNPPDWCTTNRFCDYS